MPLKYGFYAYNTTLANYFYPLRDEEAKKLGARFFEKAPFDLSQGMDAAKLPDDIANADHELVGKVLICSETKQPFKIVEAEFEFYKKLNIPLPIISPKARRIKQYEKSRIPRLIKNVCASCGREINISDTARRQQRVKNVCMDCYLKAIG